MATIPMSAQDALWLTMDRPNNLMVVDGAMVLSGTPTLAEVTEQFQAAVGRFPVLARKPFHRGTTWSWIDDTLFDITRHVTEVDLGTDADMAVLQGFVAEQRAVALSKRHPLWQAFLVSPLTLDDGTQGSAVVTRFHHAIADGVRLTQVMLGICKADPSAVVPMVVRDGTAGGPMDPARAAIAATGEAARFSMAAAQAVAARAGDLATTVGEMLTSPRRAFAAAADLPRAGRQGLESGIGVVRHPDRLLDALEILGIGDHRSMNDMSSVTKLLLTDSDRAVWTGRPGSRKAVAWSPPMPLSDVKLIAKAQGATVNDVLVAAIAGALREYLARHDQSVDEVVWMVPVNLKGFEEDLPEELGNYFALVMLAMPLHHDSPAERLRELHHRMQRIKNSDEAVLTFGLQRTMSMTPGAVATFMTNFFANKAVGVLTNVPGPTGGMTLSDVPVRQVIGFAPCSGDQPMTATIFSFNGTVTIGFATDARLLPDPETLVDLVVAEAASMRRLLVPGGATRPRD
jgi:diacylglycerol O-acyltransferase